MNKALKDIGLNPEVARVMSAMFLVGVKLAQNSQPDRYPKEIDRNTPEAVIAGLTAMYPNISHEDHMHTMLIARHIWETQIEPLLMPAPSPDDIH